jgi:hypothetical protein
LQSLRKLDKEIQQKELREKRFGCLFAPLYVLAEVLVRIAKKRQIYSKIEKETGDLLSRKEIKSGICRAFAKLGKHEILTEEKFVDLMTKAIWEMVKQKKIKFSYDPYLYAEISYQIFKTGIEKFCENSITVDSE